MGFAREAWALVLPPLLLGFGAIMVAKPIAQNWLVPVGIVLCLLALGILMFFRDPERRPPSDSSCVVAPADGVVVEIETLPNGRKFVAIFLSVLNVHVNRSPYQGTVKSVTEKPGTYHHANSREGAAGNARVDIELESTHGLIRFSQLSGLVARKISCRAKVGDKLRTGERFGLIYFGSRMEIELPATAEVTVKIGQVATAGETVIAKFPATG